MKNISFEKPTIFKNIRNLYTFKVVKFCYVFPQRIDTWDIEYKKHTTYAFLWFRLTHWHKITTQTRKYIYTVPLFADDVTNNEI